MGSSRARGCPVPGAGVATVYEPVHFEPAHDTGKEAQMLVTTVVKVAGIIAILIGL